MESRIDELLARITELADDELVELRDLIVSEFDSKKSVPGEYAMDDDALGELEALAAAATQVNRERVRREQNTTREHDAQQILSSFRTGDRQMTVPRDRRPNAARGGAATAITASGSTIHDRMELAREFDTAMRTSRAANTGDGRVLIATIHTSPDANRPTLQPNDSAEVVTASILAAERDHADQVRERIDTVRNNPSALVAAGGLGAPENPDYTLPGFEIVARPVKAALPSFLATRGGIRFMKPPTLADLNGAVGIWDVDSDIEALTNVAVRKPSLRVLPGNEIAVDVQAVTNSLFFGNMMARAWPEYVARVTDLAMAAHARIAEQQLLTQLGALSLNVTGATSPAEGGGLGATRVLLPLLDRAATGMRDRLRMQPNAPLQLILPHWARGILRTDLALQEPGDATLGTTDADLAQYFAARFVDPTWALDGEAGQQFNTQAPGPVNAWPTSIVSYLFPAGSMQFLDGGTLDLGLVRDSVLNAANDYMLFSETFESVVFRGGESFRISQPVTPNGVARAAAAS